MKRDNYNLCGYTKHPLIHHSDRVSGVEESSQAANITSER